MRSVESIRDTIRTLADERHGLHQRDANADELETNRLELAREQRELSRALIERNLCGSERNAA